VIRSLLLLAVVLLSSIQGAQASQITPRIVGGTTVPDTRYPFMVAIYFDRDGDELFFPGCGGSIVASRWVLTAAHCVSNAVTGQPEPISQIAVLADALDLTDAEQGELIGVRRVVIHPGYNALTSVSDIALIELNVALSLTPIALPQEGSQDIPTVGEQATVAGWGATAEDGRLSSQLLEVALPVRSHAACLPFYFNSLDPLANVCAGGTDTGGTDSCQGDSGGPLFVVRQNTFVQAGIVSYGEGCARPGIPGVYTRVASYSDWLASFVPNLQLVAGSRVVFDDQSAVSDIDLNRLNARTPVQFGSLQQGDVDLYEIVDAVRIDLTSISGDADLYVFDGADLRAENVICVSEATTPLDSCDLPLSNGRFVASVFSFSDSNYEIRIFNDAQASATVPDNDGELAVSSLFDGGGATGVSIIAMLASVAAIRRRYGKL
jgi:hypothetical protein